MHGQHIPPAASDTHWQQHTHATAANATHCQHKHTPVASVTHCQHKLSMPRIANTHDPAAMDSQRHTPPALLPPSPATIVLHCPLASVTGATHCQHHALSNILAASALSEVHKLQQTDPILRHKCRRGSYLIPYPTAV